jgi:hypothetical protein
MTEEEFINQIKNEISKTEKLIAEYEEVVKPESIYCVNCAS